jgi:hypothetical protein
LIYDCPKGVFGKQPAGGATDAAAVVPQLARDGRKLRIAGASIGISVISPISGRAAARGIERVPTTTTLHSTTLRPPFVIQKEVAPVMLIDGRKFELRVWLMAVFQGDEFHFYYYKNAAARVSSVLYDPTNFTREGNITTSSLYYETKEYKTRLFSTIPGYEDMYAQSLDICHLILERLRKFLYSPSQKVGYEILGFDFMFDQNTKEPKLIEINRFLGFFTCPPKVHHPDVKKLNVQMFTDIVNFLIKPVLDGKFQLGQPTIGDYIKFGTESASDSSI